MKKMVEHLKCDRHNCGKEIVINAKQGKLTKKFKYKKGLPQGWGQVEGYLLCPTCKQEYHVVFNKFMRNPKKA